MKVLHLQQPPRSDIKFERFCFPDGQFHFKLLDTVEEFEHVQIIAEIQYMTDVLILGLAVSALRSMCRGRISVNIPYMMGARMDRRIEDGTPFSLQVYAALLNAACMQVNDVRILDPHSEETWIQVDRSVVIRPDKLFAHVLDNRSLKRLAIVVPDAGAVDRVEDLMAKWYQSNRFELLYTVKCGKKRDSKTGNLSGFEILEGDPKDLDCLIVDDICDGGGTFSGLATVLREAGARTVDLCVTHGIFSKNLPIPGIDMVYTTDSYSRAWIGSEKLIVLENYLEDWVRSPK